MVVVLSIKLNNMSIFFNELLPFCPLEHPSLSQTAFTAPRVCQVPVNSGVILHLHYLNREQSVSRSGSQT